MHTLVLKAGPKGKEMNDGAPWGPRQSASANPHFLEALTTLAALHTVPLQRLLSRGCTALLESVRSSPPSGP